MSDADARIAVRTTLAVMARVAERTRTPADDLLVRILQSNEDKLTVAVHALANDAKQPPSAESIAAALAGAGIRT